MTIHPFRSAVHGIAASFILFGAIASEGCSRAWYRHDADEKAIENIQEKSTDPRWSYPDLTVYMDPRSRFFDPDDPDHSPMPPDDPASHEFMHCVYCMSGFPCWHTDGDLTQVESPDWRERLDEYLATTTDGRYRLALEDAVRLVYLHSPNYQQQLEEVYLSSLDVAFERFRFDVQFFGGNDTTYTHNGAQSGRGILDPVTGTFGDRNTLSTVSDLTAHKLFPTGAELLVGFANSIVWQFAGPDTDTNVSIFNLNFVQPLLRLGGREVVMERLTRVERGLLANLRALSRYREMMYVSIAMGAPLFGGPSRAGGFFGGAGLDAGFTGVGVGGFGGVGGATGFGRFGGGGQGGNAGGGGGAGFAGGGAGLTGGFIGLAQRRQQIRNQEANVQAILRELDRMQANFEAGRIDAFQVDQFRQSVQTQLSLLLQARLEYESQVDGYLTGLGLPPDLPVEVDDRLVRQFEFLDRPSAQLLEELSNFSTEVRRPVPPTLALAQDYLARLTEIQGRVAERIVSADADFQTLQSREPARREMFSSDEQRATFRQEVAQLGVTFAATKDKLADSRAELDRLKSALSPATLEATVQRLVDYTDELEDHLTNLSLAQARARLEIVVIAPLDLAYDDAVRIAHEHRLDWMNQRAALVDQWRLIAFNADRLESDLDVVFSGDFSTVRDNPLDFRGKTGSLSVGLQFDAPLTRVSERNQYREALINYQSVRRGYVQFEDGVKQTLRLELRTLDQARENLEFQRQSLVIALRAFDNTRLRLRQPPAPTVPGEVAQVQFGPTVARDLLGALSDLLNAQNNFMSVWLQYETTRMQLYRDLGILRLDENGLWVEGPIEPYIEAVKYLPEFGIPPMVPPGPFPPDGDNVVLKVAAPETTSWQSNHAGIPGLILPDPKEAKRDAADVMRIEFEPEE